MGVAIPRSSPATLWPESNEGRAGIRDRGQKIGPLAERVERAARGRTPEAYAIEMGSRRLQSAIVRRNDRMPRTRQAKVATVDVVENVARHVPGYRGYLEPSQRREGDRGFRSRCTSTSCTGSRNRSPT